MNNIYLLYGIDKSLIDNKVNEIKKKINVNDFDIIKYDINVDSIDSIINEISMPSLFSNTKLLLVNNSTFFSSSKSIDTTELEKYLENISKSIYIIFICNVEKIDSRKKICKLIEKLGKVIELKKGDRNYIINYLKYYINENGYKIDSYVLNKFIDKVGDNISILINELNKIFMYKLEDKTILESDIDKLTIKNLEEDIFKLTDFIIKKDKFNCFKLYQDFLNNNYEETYLIGLLASQFRFLLQVKLLCNKGKNKDEITNILSVHPYRVKLAINNLYSYSLEELTKNLNNLFILDKDIKTGLVNKKIAMELYLANL